MSRAPYRGPKGVEGLCCKCGYSGVEETPCPKDEDGHCQHWWDGDPETPGPTPPLSTKPTREEAK